MNDHTFYSLLISEIGHIVEGSVEEVPEPSTITHNDYSIDSLLAIVKERFGEETLAEISVGTREGFGVLGEKEGEPYMYHVSFYETTEKILPLDLKVKLGLKEGNQND